MINEIQAKKYCSEDVSLIENYHQAVLDPYEKWEIHHRRECDDEGRTLFTHKQLKEMNLYFDRPAEELIFVTRSTHCKMHRELYENSGKNVGKIGGKKYGAINGKKYGKIGGKISGKKRAIPILQFSKDMEFIKEWPSTCEAQRQLGISRSSICQCCQGKLKSAGGFVWKYKN